MDISLTTAAQNAVAAAREVKDRHEDEGVQYLTGAVEELAEAIEQFARKE